MARRLAGPGTALGLWACALACLAGCAAGPGTAGRRSEPPARLEAADLAGLDQRLGAALSAIAGLAGPDYLAVVTLPLASEPALADDGAGPADTLARHDLFLLSDGVEAFSPARSVLGNYRAVLASARCLPWAVQAPAGCRLLETAKRQFEGALDQVPPYTRPDFPAWKMVSAEPPDWARAGPSWSAARVSVDRYVLQMDSLFVRLQRPWLSDGFLVADGWYLAGACKGAVSAGDTGVVAGRPGRELLPQYPAGLLLARNLTLSAAGDPAERSLVSWEAPRVIAWVYRRLPPSPLNSDPCRADCADAAPRGCSARP